MKSASWSSSTRRSMPISSNGLFSMVMSEL